MLELALKIAGLLGFLLGVFNSVSAARRIHNERHPKVRLWLHTHRKKGGSSILSIEAEVVGFGVVPPLDQPKVLFASGTLASFSPTSSALISKDGKRHSYELGVYNPSDDQAKACFMYSFTTQTCYFSKEFPHSHRLYKLRRRYRPPTVLDEFSSEDDSAELNGESVERAQLIEYEELLTRGEQIRRWIHKRTGIGQPFDTQPPL